MKTAELREQFLKFFEENGHTIVPSSALVPAGDPTLLFTNAGMVQFKDCFLGTDKRPYSRATTSQKCLRISGKHNDLENVGRTARHHTFFEMLGNFSFGDYFKRDAIIFAWKFLTEVAKLPKDRLWVTIYEEDDEAGRLWSELTDVLPGRILKCGKDDNFWAMGETGPCGPCTEIHYYLGDSVATQSEAEFRKGDGQYLEIWNLVFMQFNRDVSGSLTPLPKPSVDTGMGLERIAAVKQGVTANYDTDCLRQLIRFSEKLSGKSYLGKDYTERDPESDPQYAIDVAHRVLADHVRACTFLIADGVNPGSDGRGYVVRRLIRRACRHGRVLGFRTATLYQEAEEVIAIYGATYPELVQHKEKIVRTIRGEEEKFITTLDSGLAVLQKEVSALKSQQRRSLSGEFAFLLHDTYGFPLDMTEDIVRQAKLTVDQAGFAKQMEQQRERSRSARGADSLLQLQRSVKPHGTQFKGYEYNEYESKLHGIFGQDGERQVAKAGDEVAIVSDETPFYAESGGQVGDTGSMSGANGWVEVLDTQKAGGDTIVHLCRVVEGEIQTGEQLRLSIDAHRREMIRANHSATHLLHLALREVLGTHVKQAGSRVSDNTLRFDFSHFEPVTSEQLEEIEKIMNSEVRANHQVRTLEMPLEEARASGAMALFGEKYGTRVRVVEIGPRSRELCGGTHTSRSGDIGLIGLLGEGSVAAGVRRVEAVGGVGAVQELARLRGNLSQTAALMKSSPQEVVERVQRLLERVRELEQQVNKSSQSMLAGKAGSLAESAQKIGNVSVVATRLDGVEPKQLREIADDLKQRLKSGVIALVGVNDGKAVMLTAATSDLAEKYHAGKLLEAMTAVLGSRGGGRADLAQAGGGDVAKLDQALERFRELVQKA